MVGSLEQRLTIAEQIADGEPMQKITVPLLPLLAHAKCPKCDRKLQATCAASDLMTLSMPPRLRPRL